MAYLLIALPLALTALAWVMPSNRWRPWLLPAGGLGHLALVLIAVFQPLDGVPVSGFGDALLLDALGKVILGFVRSI